MDDKIWQLLGKIKPIEPPSNFNALFWEKVELKDKQAKARHTAFVFPLLNRRLTYALASLVIIISLSFVLQLQQKKELDKLARSFKSAEEIEMVKNLDVLKDMDIVQNMDLLENYEVIQNLEETSTI